MMMRRLCVLSAVGCVRAIATTSTLRMRNLGSSTLRVTEACLGTMTWGVQNTESEAHEQLDYAIKERGVNFLDTAELYPVAFNYGKTTELWIGKWLKARKGKVDRDKLYIATKCNPMLFGRS